MYNKRKETIERSFADAKELGQDGLGKGDLLYFDNRSRQIFNLIKVSPIKVGFTQQPEDLFQGLLNNFTFSINDYA